MLLPIEIIILIQSFCTFRGAGTMRCVNKILCEHLFARNIYHCHICNGYYVISQHIEFCMTPCIVFYKNLLHIRDITCAEYSITNNVNRRQRPSCIRVHNDRRYLELYINGIIYRFQYSIPVHISLAIHGRNYEYIKIHNSWFAGSRIGVYILCNYIYEYIPEMFELVMRYHNGRLLSSRDELLKLYPISK